MYFCAVVSVSAWQICPKYVIDAPLLVSHDLVSVSAHWTLLEDERTFTFLLDFFFCFLKSVLILVMFTLFFDILCILQQNLFSRQLNSIYINLFL